MSDVEKGRAPDKGEKPVREYVPGHRPPPAAGCFGKVCPVEPPKRSRRAGPLSIEEFETRYAWIGMTGSKGSADRHNHVI